MVSKFSNKLRPILYSRRAEPDRLGRESVWYLKGYVQEDPEPPEPRGEEEIIF